MAIRMYSGLPGSGKTTKLAQIALEKLEQYPKLEKQGELRTLRSNIKFSDEIENKYLKYIEYFEDIYDMPNWHDSDIFIDEAAVYFDSRSWEMMPKGIRRFLFTHRHLGCELYMIAQDFTTIDNSFRRLTANLYYVHKILSTREPSYHGKPIKRPFNLARIGTVKKAYWHMEKEHYQYEQQQLTLFTRKHFAIFDTRQSLPEQDLPPLIKQVRVCPEDGYTRTKYI